MYSTNVQRSFRFLLALSSLLLFTYGHAQNNALDFDGSNDLVTTSDFFEFRTDYSVEAWVNTTATTGMIVSKWDAGDGNSTFSLQLSSGRPWASNNEAPFSFISTRTINDGNWHHIAVTYDLSATTLTMYVDGLLDITNSSAGVNGTQNDFDITLGAEPDGGTPLDGTIDEVRIWNDVRTEEELALNMNHELSGSETGLIAYYNFDQGTAGGSNGAFTSLPDESTNSNTGTLSNFALTGSSSNYLTGFSATNHALDFDGTNDFVNVASPYTSFGTEITVETWINLTTLTSAEGVMGQSTANSDNSGTNVWLLGNIGTSDGSLTFFVWDGSNVRSATSTTDFAGTGWHHVVGVADATSTRIYVDGTLEASGTGISSGIQSNGSAVVHVGKDTRYPSARFADGLIDEVRIWSDARTCSEILSTKDVELTGSETGLVAYYNFNHGFASGTNTGLTTLPDLSGNNSDGTLTNFALSSTSSNYLDGSGNGVSGNTPVDQPEINVQGNSNDIADGSTAINATIDTDFGTQTSSNAIIYTIQNTGPTTLNISGITSTGTNSGDFVVSGAPTTVAASGSETFTVTFSPLATGTRDATITINSDDCDEAAYDFVVQGVGDTNHALNFDGSDDYVDLGDLALTSGTVSMWIYADALPDNQRIYAQPTGATSQAGSLGIDPTNTDDFDIFVWTGAAWLKLVDVSSDWSGAWHHLAVVYSGGNATAYWDGAEQLTQTTNFDFNGVSFGLGSVYTGPNGTYWDGSFDEVSIWNTARTCSEILATKDVELTGSESGLVAYYNFNQNEAGGTNTGQTTLDDLTSNNNDGTLTNFALTGSTSNWMDGSGNNVSNSTTPVDQPEINVQGNSMNIADGSTTISTTIDTDFGLTYTSGNAITYTIQNTGTATLNISSVTSSGTNSSEFVVSGAPSSVAASGSETFIVTFTPGGSGNRTATITVNSDDCDEAAYDFAVQGSGPAPGGISLDLQLWLKAGEGFAASQWDDQSGNSNHATQGTGAAQPSSTSDAINFNTAIDFDGSDFLTLTNDAGTMGLNNSDYELLFVANSSSTAVQFFMSTVTQERYEMHINGASGHRFIPANATNFSDIGADSEYDDGLSRIFGGTLQSSGASAASHVNGLFTTDIETAGLQTTETGTITIGRRESTDTFHWTGQMGEVVIFGDALTATQRQQVFTYLALKYGITLDQTSATNYLAADGGVVWNATTNATYNNDVAGLARDDASELDQKQSGSINTGAIVEVANGTHSSPSVYSSDDSWLIWGHDGGASTFGTDNINNSNATTSNRMTRAWRVQETGTVGSVEIRFSNSMATGTVSLVAHTSDGSFPADVNRRVVEMTDDGTHYTASIDLADGEYFSFANANYATLTSQFVVINEVVTDPQQDWGASNFFNPSPGGTGDADDEWIELYITTDDLDLTSWTIEMNDGTDVSGSLSAGGAFNQSNYRSLTGGFLNNTKSGDYLILGDPSSGMMNSTGTLTVILKDGSSGIIDQVTIATGSGTGFNSNASSTSDEAVARIPNGSDTDIDATDFVKTLASLGATSSPSGTVVINEVVTDPFTDWSTSSFDGTIGAGTVSGVDEWIELYIGTSGLNLTGWTMELNDGSDVSGSIASGGLFETVNYVSTGSGSFISTEIGDYLILGNPSGEINNTGLSIILRDAGNTIVDQVTIGGGSGEAPSGSNSAFNSEAVVRYPNATDTGTDDVDFVQTRPTIGATNSPTGTVLINEIVTDPQQDWSTNDFDGTIAGGSVTGSDEWIELYIGTDNVNLTGWTLRIEDGTDSQDGIITTSGPFGDAVYFSNNSGEFVNTRSGDFYVLGNATGEMEDDVVITLRDATGTIVDQVELGDDISGDGNGDGAPDGSSNGGLATGIADEAIARIPNGTDTGNDVNDFSAVPASLGSMNSTAQLPGVGNGLVFDGTNDLVNLGSQILSSSTFTVEARVNGSSFANTGRFNRILALNYGSYTSDNPFVLFVNNSGNIGYVFGTGDASTDQQVPLSFSPTLSTSTWYHVALTFDGSEKRLYVDGVLYGTITDAGTFTNTNSEPLLIGDFDTGTSNDGEWEGSIDEVRIWNDVRTHEEIVENMTGLLDPSTANLQAYYRFDQSSGTSLPDLTSNNNDGTLTNMVGTEWAAAGWNIFAQNQAIFQSGGSDVSTGTSGELTLTDVSFQNDDNDLLLAGHDNGNFSEVITDLPSGTLLNARYDRIWNLTKNDASGTSNGSVRLGFDLGTTPSVTYTYYLLERTGTSGDFAIVPTLGVNPNSSSIEFIVDASAIDDGSYYTLGRSDVGVGNALNFDDTNDQVVIPHNSAFNLNSGDYTFEAWIYPTDGTAETIISKGAGGGAANTDIFIFSLVGNNLFFQLGKVGATSETHTSNTAISLNTWSHVAAVYNSSTMTVTFFLNGLSDGGGTYSGTLYNADTNPTFIGRQGNTCNCNFFAGNIDELRVWNDQRTQQEILDNMVANLTGDETNLLAYYRFNQGIGDSNIALPDLTANGHGGTLTNFTNLGGSMTSSNYIASTRTGITTSVIISNGGNLTATNGELTLTSTQNAGDFLQDANDFIRWNNDGGAFTETTADIPTGTLVTSRYTKTWQIDKNDAVGTANGNVTFTFDLGAIPDPDYTYFLLSRSGTSGDFSIVEVLSSYPSSNNISFIVDGGEMTHDYYFTLGRTDAGAGNTLDFDADNDYIDVADADAFTFGNGTTDSPFSIETWVRIDNTAEFTMISKKSGGLSAGEWYMGSGTGGQFHVTLWDESAGGSVFQQTAAGLFSAGEWYHLAFTYDGSGSANGLTLYVDGIPSNDGTGGSGSYTAMENTTSSVQFGVVTNTFSNLNGALDEIRIWSDERTEQEIRDNMNRKLDVANESNLVAYYQFNTGIADGTNTGVDVLTDRSGNGNSGTLTNFALSSTSSNWVASTASVADQSLANSLQGAGNALDFDGSDDRVSIADNSTLEPINDFLTVEAWVRPDVTTSFRGVVSRYYTSGDASNVFVLQINAGNYQFLINESDNNLVTASATATASTWTHVAGVADGSQVHLYLDGILMSSTAYDGTITKNSSREMYIGRYRNDSFGQYDGLIDEVRIWNTARTGAEIQANMFESLTGSETGLVAYYTFDESSGTTLDDNSTNTNNGALTNMDDADWVDGSAREPFKTNGPGNLNSGNTWVGGASPGASQKLYVQHDLTVDADLTVDDFNLTSGSTLTLSGGQTLTVTGNLVNNGTITGDGKIQFTSGNPMISGGTFSNLEMNGGSPILCGNTTLTGTLTMTSGNLQLEGFNLTLNSGASISGGSSSSYIQTINHNDSGGSIEMEIGTADGVVTYPIGTNTNYTPISFTNLGTTATFAIRTFDGIYAYNTSGAAFTSNVISKTWDVNATGSGFNITLSIQWNTADEAAGFDRSNMFISTNDGTSWVERAGPLSATEVSSGIYQAAASGISSFSGVGGGGDVITPVALLDFYALQIEEGIELVWHTATEIDNEKFIIERSADGIAFEVLNEIPGNGDSEDIIEYRFVDTDPLAGSNYYRLMQVDYDGDFEYSPIVIAETEIEEHDLVVYPNPFSDRLYIGLKEADTPANIKITGINGQVILEETVISDNRFIQFENLRVPPGLYILEVQQGDEIVRMRLVNE